MKLVYAMLHYCTVPTQYFCENFRKCRSIFTRDAAQSAVMQQ